jgi:succinyl-diaminopimelate desuccinylase
MEDLLRKLVAYPSVTGDAQTSHEIMEFVATFVADRGMHVERYVYNGYESLVATTQPGDKSPDVMLAAHADVVAASDELFTLRKQDGRIYGRGVLDMKFALAGYLQIIDDLKDRLHEYSLGLMVTADEETGGWHGTPLLLKEGYRAKVFILPDGGENWQVQTASKGILVYKITAHGTSAHSSRHWQGSNALEKLLPVIPELEALLPKQQGPDTSSISINKINAGKAINQVPDKASLTADIRPLDAAEYQRLHRAVTELCARYDLDWEMEADGNPTYFDLNDPYIEPYVRLIEQTTGVRVVGSHTLGSNDSRFVVPFGIPCISFYPTGAGHHSAEEWISERSLEDFRQITTQYIEQMARLSPSSDTPVPVTSKRTSHQAWRVASSVE